MKQTTWEKDHVQKKRAKLQPKNGIAMCRFVIKETV